MLELAVVGGALLVGIPTAVYVGVRMQRSQRWSWCAAARAAGLEGVVPASGFWSKGLVTARAGDHAMRIEEYARSKYDKGIRFVIEGDSGLTLRAESAMAKVQKALGRREIELGDEDFDADVFVQGDPVMVRAVLDVETRRMLRPLVDGRIRLARVEGGLAARMAVDDGDIVLEVPGRHEGVLRERLVEVLQAPLALAQRLERPANALQRLVENTRTEPEWRVRQETLRLLASTFPNHSVTRVALQHGCEDERQEIQLQCALELFDGTGQATLLELASNEWADDAVAAKAVSTLGRALPAERAQAILAHALRTRRLKTAAACVTVLGETADERVVETLTKVIRLESGPVAQAAIAALGRTSGAAVEGALIEALSGGEHALCLAAVQSLGRVGTTAAVLPLREAAERDGGLAKATREAIARIQARASGVPGQVSLAQGAEGQVSLAGDGPRGRISLDEP